MSFLTFLEQVHIPALNHIGLWIDDLEACVEELEGKGEGAQNLALII